MASLKDYFIQLIDYYRTGDKGTLPSAIIAIADNQYNIAQDYFNRNIDLSSFIAYDYINVKKFLIDWYAAARTIVELHKSIKDPYSLDNDQLDTWIKSLGFIYPDFIPDNNKPTFLLELVNLYKIKGSPQSLLKLVQFLNYTDFKVLEYWLVADQNAYDMHYDSGYFYDENPIRQLMFIGKQVGRMLEQHPFTTRYTYDQFKSKHLDAHWYYDKRHISHLSDSTPLSLPSLTPYFGLFNVQYLTKKWLPTIACLSRITYNAYQDYISSGINPRTIIIDGYNDLVSLLELQLGIWWLYFVRIGFLNRDTNTLDPTVWNSIPNDKLSYICYSVDIANKININQFKEDFKRLYDEAPPNREALYNYIRERKDKFTLPTNHPLFEDATQIKPLLYQLNPSYYDYLYDVSLLDADEIKHELNKQLVCIDNVLGALDITLATLDNVVLFEGLSIYTLINFFKPIYSRLVNLAFGLLLSDQVGDRIIAEDQQRQDISIILDSGLYNKEEPRCPYYDCKCNYYDEWIRYILCDNTLINILPVTFPEDSVNDIYDNMYNTVCQSVNEVYQILEKMAIPKITHVQRDGLRQEYQYDTGDYYDTEGMVIYDGFEVIII